MVKATFYVKRKLNIINNTFPSVFSHSFITSIFYFQYFRTVNTRVSVVYIETWQGQNQAKIDGGQDISKAISNFNDYTTRNLYKIDKDTTQLLT